MKKSVFFLLAALCVALTSCNDDWGYSDPIGANVIGVGNMHYDAEHRLYTVMIDSVSYSISEITVFDKHPTTFSDIKRVPELEGVIVTVFTSNRNMGAQAVTGNKTTDEIEAMFRHHVMRGIAIVCIILLCFLAFLGGGDLWLKFQKRHRDERREQAQDEE